MVRKSNIRTYTPPEQVKVEPNIAIVKDLLADNIDVHVITSVMRPLELLNLLPKINIDLL